MIVGMLAVETNEVFHNGKAIIQRWSGSRGNVCLLQRVMCWQSLAPLRGDSDDDAGAPQRCDVGQGQRPSLRRAIKLTIEVRRPVFDWMGRASLINDW